MEVLLKYLDAVLEIDFGNELRHVHSIVINGKTIINTGYDPLQ